MKKPAWEVNKYPRLLYPRDRKYLDERRHERVWTRNSYSGSLLKTPLGAEAKLGLGWDEELNWRGRRPPKSAYGARQMWDKNIDRKQPRTLLKAYIPGFGASDIPIYREEEYRKRGYTYFELFTIVGSAP